MKRFIHSIPLEIRYLLKVYFSGIIVFTIFRIFFILFNLQQAGTATKDLIAKAFLMGLRFDTVVSCYLLTVPALLLIINLFEKKKSYRLNKIINRYTIVVYIIAFLVCSVDIPYFRHYLSRVTVSVLNWTNSPMFMLRMIFENKINFFFIAFFGALTYLAAFRVRVINDKTLLIHKETLFINNRHKQLNVFYSVLIVGLLFLGIRGRVTLKSPIQWGTAFTSDNNFANQMGLNPNFTFFKSCITSLNPKNRKLDLMSDSLAIKNIQEDFGIQKAYSVEYPIARKIDVKGVPLKANVVVVVMEAMGLSKTGLDNNAVAMTPYLDSLAKLSYTFTNVFSAGIHTYNGVYATLFGMPALMNQHPMENENSNQPFTGIAYTLNQFNYQTAFICPHDEEFDNMAGFLKANGYQKIVGQKDFPSEEIHSTMGVPDDVLFEHAVNQINEMAKTPKPFFTTILTGSDHEPNYIPEGHGFIPKTKEEKQQITEYADWSINKFLKLCSAETWYDSTIFVFVADHGSWYRDYYEMSLSYNKVPLLIFSPKLINPKMNAAVGGQIDVFPTVMGLLNQPYINNTMGVDLIKEGRKYIAFSADDKLGCVNDQYFWYYNYVADNQYLLHYRDKEPNQYLQKFPELADTLKNYAHSLLQATQWMIENKKAGPLK